jgi:amino acid transporter
MKKKDDNNHLILRIIQQNFDTHVLKRSVIAAAIIGSILTFVNQPLAIFGHESLVKFKLILAFVLPFIVISISQMLGKYQAKIDKVDSQSQFFHEKLLKTMVSHNIPARALVLCLIVGSLASVVTLSNFLLHDKNTNIDWNFMIQPYLFSLFFGAFSQAISYQRHIK